MRALVLCLLAGCGAGTVDLELVQTAPMAIDLAALADTTLLVRSPDMCVDPKVTLDGAPYGGPKSVSAAGLLLAGGKVFADAFALSHPAWQAACEVSVRARLEVDCSASAPAFPAGQDLVYGSARASLDVPVALTGHLAVTPLPQGEGVSPYAVPHVLVVGTPSLRAGLLTVPGVDLVPQVFASDDGDIVAWIPYGPLAAGRTYEATLRGGPGGLRTTVGRCVAEDVRWSFTVRGADEPPFKAWWETRGERPWFVWDDLGDANYLVETKDRNHVTYTKVADHLVRPVRSAGLDEPPRCFRVVANLPDGKTLTSPDACR